MRFRPGPQKVSLRHWIPQKNGVCAQTRTQEEIFEYMARRLPPLGKNTRRSQAVDEEYHPGLPGSFRHQGREHGGGPGERTVRFQDREGGRTDSRTRRRRRSSGSRSQRKVLARNKDRDTDRHTAALRANRGPWRTGVREENSSSGRRRVPTSRMCF